MTHPVKCEASEAGPKGRAKTSPPRYHCTSCLDGSHVCSVMIPLDWPGATPGSRCACRRCCDQRYATRVVDTGKTVRPLVAPAPTGRRRGRPISKWTDEKLAELLQLQAQGLSSPQIAERVGSSSDVVRHYIKRAREKGLVAA